MAKEDCAIYREWLQEIEKTTEKFLRAAAMGKMIRHVKRCPVCNGVSSSLDPKTPR